VVKNIISKKKEFIFPISGLLPGSLLVILREGADSGSGERTWLKAIATKVFMFSPKA